MSRGSSGCAFHSAVRIGDAHLQDAAVAVDVLDRRGRRASSSSKGYGRVLERGSSCGLSASAHSAPSGLIARADVERARVERARDVRIRAVAAHVSTSGNSRFAADAATSVAWMLPSTQNAGLSAAAPVFALRHRRDPRCRALRGSCPIDSTATRSGILARDARAGARSARHSGRSGRWRRRRMVDPGTPRASAVTAVLPSFTRPSRGGNRVGASAAAPPAIELDEVRPRLRMLRIELQRALERDARLRAFRLLPPRDAQVVPGPRVARIRREGRLPQLRPRRGNRGCAAR